MNLQAVGVPGPLSWTLFEAAALRYLITYVKNVICNSHKEYKLAQLLDKIHYYNAFVNFCATHYINDEEREAAPSVKENMRPLHQSSLRILFETA